MKHLRKITFFIFCTLLSAPFSFGQQPSDVKLDPKTYASYLGTYQLDSGELITIGRTERRLYYFEPESGQIRGLQRESDTKWTSGPSLLIYAPTEYEITFVKNPDGVVTSLVRKKSGGPNEPAKKTQFYKEEETTFRNEMYNLQEQYCYLQLLDLILLLCSCMVLEHRIGMGMYL